MKSYKIGHLTSVHARYDTRIFLKQCRSLASARYQVSLVVADGLGDEEKDGVRILDAGRPSGRLDRMLGATRRVLARARSLDADLYQLHDPELLPAGLALKRAGARVVFDAHEDLPRQILSKPYLHPALRGVVSAAAARFERFACGRLDHVVAATPNIRAKFAAMGMPVVDVNNFPMAGEFEADVPWTAKEHQVCYVGGIATVRGIREVVTAMALCMSGARLELGGKFGERGLREEVTALPGWTMVDERGFLSRAGVRGVFERSVAGLVTLHPTTAYLDSLPVKMFEYMSAGLPVIASNFPLWREIVEGNACGVCVDPMSPHEIAAAIDYLVENPDIARTMGENGRRAVLERYNWTAEERKLLELYARIVPTDAGANTA